MAWVIETARGVLEGRLSAADGATSLRVQQAQLVALLAHDRDSVTRRESDAVASRLRLLAEQVADLGSTTPDNADYQDMARVLGELARSLR